MKKQYGYIAPVSMFIILILAICALFPHSASAQAPTRLCALAGDGKSCVPSLFPSSSSALAANQVVAALPANLWSFEVSADSTLSAAAWFIMIYDATTAPSDGSVTPAKCYALASGTTLFSASFTLPIQFQNGIVIGVSTTGCFTKTASIHAYISGDAR